MYPEPGREDQRDLPELLDNRPLSVIVLQFAGALSAVGFVAILAALLLSTASWATMGGFGGALLLDIVFLAGVVSRYVRWTGWVHTVRSQATDLAQDMPWATLPLLGADAVPTADLLQVIVDRLDEGSKWLTRAEAALRDVGALRDARAVSEQRQLATERLRLQFSQYRRDQ